MVVIGERVDSSRSERRIKCQADVQYCVDIVDDNYQPGAAT